eukprot:PhM_4_TR18010/c0_g1_i1/m.33428
MAASASSFPILLVLLILGCATTTTVSAWPDLSYDLSSSSTRFCSTSSKRSLAFTTPAAMNVSYLNLSPWRFPTTAGSRFETDLTLSCVITRTRTLHLVPNYFHVGYVAMGAPSNGRSYLMTGGGAGAFPIFLSVPDNVTCTLELPSIYDGVCVHATLGYRAMFREAVPIILSSSATSQQRVFALVSHDSGVSFTLPGRSHNLLGTGMISTTVTTADTVVVVRPDRPNSASSFNFAWNINATLSVPSVDLTDRVGYSVVAEAGINFRTARTRCDLAAMRTAGVNSVAQQLAAIVPLSHVWLGASDAVTEGTWRWFTTGTLLQPPNYANWQSGAPFNGTVIHYLRMNVASGSWADTSADDAAVGGYVCETLLDPTASNATVVPTCSMLTTETTCQENLFCSWNETCRPRQAWECPLAPVVVHSACNMALSGAPTPQQIFSAFCNVTSNASKCDRIRRYCVEGQTFTMNDIANWVLAEVCATTSMCMVPGATCAVTPPPATPTPPTPAPPATPPPPTPPPVAAAKIVFTIVTPFTTDSVRDGTAMVQLALIPSELTWDPQISAIGVNAAFEVSGSHNFFGFGKYRDELLPQSNIIVQGNVLKIKMGPNSKFSPENDEDLTLRPKLSWVPKALSFDVANPAYGIRVTSSSSSTEKNAGTGVTATAMAGALGSVAGAGSLQLSILLAGMSCGQGRLSNTVSGASWILAPIQPSYGDGETATHRGMIIAQSMLMVVITAAHFTIGIFVMCLFNKTVRVSMNLIYFPIITLRVYIFLLQGLTVALFTILFRDDSIPWKFVATTLCLGYNVMFIAYCCHYVRTLPAEFIIYDPDRFPRDSLIKKFYYPVGVWIPEAIVNCYGVLFYPFIPHRRWFIGFTLVFYVIVALIAAIVPDNLPQCRAQYSVLVVVFFWYFASMVYLRPHRHNFMNVFQPLIVFTQMLVVIFMLIRSDSEDPNHWTISASVGATYASTTLTVLTFVPLIGLSVYEEFWLKDALLEWLQLTDKDDDDDDEDEKNKSLNASKNGVTIVSLPSIKDVQQTVVVVSNAPNSPEFEPVISRLVPNIVAIRRPRASSPSASSAPVSPAHITFKDAASCAKGYDLLDGMEIIIEGSVYVLEVEERVVPRLTRSASMLQSLSSFRSLPGKLVAGMSLNSNSSGGQHANCVFITNVPLDADEGAVRELAVLYGVVRKVELSSARDENGYRVARVEYCTAHGALTARKRLPRKHFLSGENLTVSEDPPKWEEMKDQKKAGEDDGKKSKAAQNHHQNDVFADINAGLPPLTITRPEIVSLPTVRVDGLPTGTSRDEVISVLENAGIRGVDSVELQPDGSAHVIFTDTDTCEKAQRRLSDHVMPDGSVLSTSFSETKKVKHVPVRQMSIKSNNNKDEPADAMTHSLTLVNLPKDATTEDVLEVIAGAVGPNNTATAIKNIIVQPDGTAEVVFYDPVVAESTRELLSNTILDGSAVRALRGMRSSLQPTAVPVICLDGAATNVSDVRALVKDMAGVRAVEMQPNGTAHIIFTDAASAERAQEHLSDRIMPDGTVLNASQRTITRLEERKKTPNINNNTNYHNTELTPTSVTINLKQVPDMAVLKLSAGHYISKDPASNTATIFLPTLEDANTLAATISSHFLPKSKPVVDSSDVVKSIVDRCVVVDGVTRATEERLRRIANSTGGLKSIQEHQGQHVLEFQTTTDALRAGDVLAGNSTGVWNVHSASSPEVVAALLGVEQQRLPVVTTQVVSAAAPTPAAAVPPSSAPQPTLVMQGLDRGTTREDVLRECERLGINPTDVCLVERHTEDILGPVVTCEAKVSFRNAPEAAAAQSVMGEAMAMAVDDGTTRSDSVLGLGVRVVPVDKLPHRTYEIHNVPPNTTPSDVISWLCNGDTAKQSSSVTCVVDQRNGVAHVRVVESDDAAVDVVGNMNERIVDGHVLRVGGGASRGVGPARSAASAPQPTNSPPKSVVVTHVRDGKFDPSLCPAPTAVLVDGDTSRSLHDYAIRSSARQSGSATGITPIGNHTLVNLETPEQAKLFAASCTLPSQLIYDIIVEDADPGAVVGALQRYRLPVPVVMDASGVMHLLPTTSQMASVANIVPLRVVPVASLSQELRSETAALVHIPPKMNKNQTADSVNNNPLHNNSTTTIQSDAAAERTILLENVPSTMSNAELAQSFARYGEVSAVSKAAFSGKAFVHMTAKAAAERAMVGLSVVPHPSGFRVSRATPVTIDETNALTLRMSRMKSFPLLSEASSAHRRPPLPRHSDIMVHEDEWREEVSPARRIDNWSSSPSSSNNNNNEMIDEMIEI